MKLRCNKTRWLTGAPSLAVRGLRLLGCGRTRLDKGAKAISGESAEDEKAAGDRRMLLLDILNGSTDWLDV